MSQFILSLMATIVLSSANANAQMMNDVTIQNQCSDSTSPDTNLPCQHSEGFVRSEISANLLDNLNLFQDPFYQRFQLHHAPQPLRLTNTIIKDYFFPTFYGNVTVSVAMFFCEYDRALALMPNPGVKPINMGAGRSLVVISSYRYNKVYGIPPYNEVSIAIPVIEDQLLNPPVLPLLIPNYEGLGFYVLSMPVTSVENEIRGHRLWGLNKIAQQIELKADGNDYVTTVHEQDGTRYLEFRVPMYGSIENVDEARYVYSSLEGNLVRAKTSTKGTFQVNTSPLALLLPELNSSEPSIKIGDGPSAQMLKRLNIETKPFQTRFAPAVNSVFDLPDTKFAQKNQ